MPDFYAYTLSLHDNQRRSIITDIHISASRLNIAPSGLMVKALIDTGATMSGISQKTAQALHLRPLKMKRVFTAQGRFLASTYLIDITFPTMPVIPSIQVMDFPEGHGFDFVIGMDILRMGDMAITNANNITVFSFRVPPDTRHTDYTHHRS